MKRICGKIEFAVKKSMTVVHVGDSGDDGRDEPTWVGSCLGCERV